MTAYKLDHYTIRCADLEKTKDFYCNIVGLRVGDRPAIPVDGYWLYTGDTPSVHLMDKQQLAERSGEPPRTDPETAALDHVAFGCRDLKAAKARLTENNIEFRESAFPGFLVQLFITDPDNILVELNFREAD